VSEPGPPLSRDDNFLIAAALSDALHTILSAASVADDSTSEEWRDTLEEAQRIYRKLGPRLMQFDDRFQKNEQDGDTRRRDK